MVRHWSKTTRWRSWNRTIPAVARKTLISLFASLRFISSFPLRLCGKTPNGLVLASYWRWNGGVLAWNRLAVALRYALDTPQRFFCSFLRLFVPFRSFSSRNDPAQFSGAVILYSKKQHLYITAATKLQVVKLAALRLSPAYFLLL